ncbi:MFS transporter [Nocardia sp. NPDC052254]|uniref:MFS transporter n=1 Tax=Nocardia sp. NPDC052254 TaxID=3155681 RepID=UPI00341F2566
MTATLSPTRSSRRFGRREIYAVTGCYFVASFAALGLPPYFTEILPALGDPTGRWAGLLYIVPSVFAGLGAPLWGRLADRYGRKPILLRAQLGLAGAFVLAGLADSLPVFAVALVLQGVFGGTYAASSGYLGAGLHGPDLARALIVLQGSARAALVVAPIAVGALTHWQQPHHQYLLLAALPLAAAVLVAMLPEPTRSEHESDSGSAAVHNRTAHGSRRVLFAVEFAFVFTTVVSFPYFVSLLSERVPGLPAILVGSLFALPHLIYLLSSLAVHRLSGDPWPLIVTGFAVLAAALAMHAVAGSLPVFVAARILLGAGLTLVLVGRTVLAADCAAGRAAGGMFGALEFFTKAGAVAAGLAATAAVAHFGPAAAPLCGAAGAVIVLIVIVIRRLSRQMESDHVTTS